MLQKIIFRLLWCSLIPLVSLNCLAKDTLVIGTVSTNPKKHYHTLKPIADYVVSKMHSLGITKSKVVMARNNQHMIQLLKEGKVDWVTETPFSAIEFEQQTGAQLLLLKRKKGVLFYYSVFFTRKNSSIESLNQLLGKTIAFEDKGSTSAFYVPAAELIELDLPLLHLSEPRKTPPPNKVGYAFSGSEINTASWIHIGVADVGAISNLDWDKEENMPLKLRKNFKVIHRTKPFPRAIELVRRQLDPQLKQRLKQILLNIHLNKLGREVLYSYQKTSRFDEINDEIKASLQHTRKIYELVNHHLN